MKITEIDIKIIISDVLYKSLDINLIKIRLKELLKLLKNSNNFSESEKYFFEVEAIHYILSKYLFEYHLFLDDTLHEFIRIFERLDDSENRQYLFKEIKSEKIIF